MPFQPVNNTAKVDALFLVNGAESAQFSMYANTDIGAWDATQLQALCDAVNDSIVADYVPALSDQHDFLGSEARDLEVEFGRVETLLLGAPAAGTLASPPLPGNVAVVGTLKSSTGAPRRGRVYLMPPAEAQVTGDLLTAGALTALQAALQSITNAIDGVGAGVAHVIVSRYQGSSLVEQPDGQIIKKPTLRSPNAVVANVSSVEVQSRVASQRRRLVAG